jgi:D-glucuronyl C5-epimerase C-terminus
VRWTIAVGVTVTTLVLAGGAPATTLLPAQRTALKAVALARAANHLDAATAAAARREITRSAKLIRNLPASRSRPLAACLDQVAALQGKLTAPRATAVIGQLALNDDWFARRGPPPAQTDVADAEGVVYRYFSGRCFEFHPLANFGALNADVAAGNSDAAAQLATALAARAVPEPGGGLGWEYYFNFSNGRAPWLSGMAQAVAAQAFAGVAAASSSSFDTAGRAYRTIGGRQLLTQVAAGPWIRLYGFSSLVVLNAQLQTVLSLQSYAHSSGNATAGALATRMQTSAAEMLPRFDTGYWSDYSLAGDPAPVSYQEYVTQLLHKLASADPRFAAAATRFTGYLTQPPAFKLSNAPVGSARFWLSKPAHVDAQSPAGPTRSLTLNPGWHTVTWKLPALSGLYPVHLTARDWVGNTASIDALPIVRAAGISGTSATTGQTGAPPAPPAQPSFVVGAGLDVPTQGTLARQLGLGVVRMAVAWPAGATSPDPGLIQALQRVPAGTGIVVELTAAPLPVDDPGRAALAAYAVSLAQQAPAIRDLVLSPAVTVATAPAYVATLGAVRQAIQAALPAVAVGAALDGSQTPRAALAALVTAADITGQTVLDVIAFRPAPAVATGAWTIADLKTIETVLGQSFTTAPPLLVDGLAAASAVPAAKAPAYGTPPAAGGLTEADQGSTYAATITSASCDPAIAGVIIDRLVDAATPAPTSGLFYPDSTPKASAAVVGAAAVAAQRGSLVCPGVQAAAGASALVFPAAVANGATTPVQLGCARDCLYLITLERADGIPVVAKRGALIGGAAPKLIALPKAQLAAGAYRIAVRLVTQTNPGPIAVILSQPLTVA